MRVLLLVFCTLVLAGTARAADLTVSVRDAAGAPVANAAVLFRPENVPPASSIHFDWPYRIAQQNIQFAPRLLIVPVGATVAFPNLDSVRHHVYSFSTGNRFELRLYGHDETRTYTFNTLGVAAIGCNIHDQMSAYVLVVDTPHAGVTDASGRVILHGAHGAGELRVWRQDVRAPGNQVTTPLTLPEVGTASRDVTVNLHPAAPMQMH
jgi:plastocyanin